MSINHESKSTDFHVFQFVFDYSEGDVFGCVADIGWITGHSYVVYGPLCNGATTVLFESVPTYPDPGKCMFEVRDGLPCPWNAMFGCPETFVALQ